MENLLPADWEKIQEFYTAKGKLSGEYHFIHIDPE